MHAIEWDNYFQQILSRSLWLQVEFSGGDVSFFQKKITLEELEAVY